MKVAWDSGDPSAGDCLPQAFQKPLEMGHAFSEVADLAPQFFDPRVNVLTQFFALRFQAVHAGGKVAPQRTALRDYQRREGSADGNDGNEFFHARSLASGLR